MHGVLALLFQLLAVYGYPALFALLVLGIVGLPVPDETLLTFCGYLIYAGQLSPGLTFAVGLCGSICGVSISYWFGARFGERLIVRFGKYVHLTQTRLFRVERMFLRFGPILLTVGYFIPGVRHFTAVVAGMSRVPLRKFATFAYSGAVLWVGTFLTLGYFFGDRWQHSSEVAHRYVLQFIGVIAAVLAVVWLVRLQRSRKV